MAPVFISGMLYAKDEERHLGPTGLFGAVDKQQIKVTRVAEGSPADGSLKAGDVILGAGGALFKNDVRRELADAIDQAETEQSKGLLTLTLKDNKKVDLHLKVLGSYSATAPYNCPKTDAIITRAADSLLKIKDLGKSNLPIDYLGLLATGEQKYIDVVKKGLPNQKWAQPDMGELMAVIKGDKDSGAVGWSWGYSCLTLCEYHLLTGDESVLPAIKAYAIALAMGQDAGGLWGHRTAAETRGGRLPGYAQINQPSLTCFLGMLLAEKCGIKDPELTRGIGKTHAFFANFIGKGALPYGVHNPNPKTYNNNGTSGSAAVAFAIKGNTRGAEFFSKLCTTSYGTLETGHTGHYFNQLWTGLGVNMAGPEASAAFFKETRWLHTLNRTWEGGFTYDDETGNCFSYRGCSDAGSHLLNYCLGRRKLAITGRDSDPSIWLKGKELADTLALSTMDYSKKSDEELLALFGHPLPQVRGQAIWTLRSRKHTLSAPLLKMVQAGTDEQRLSATGYFGYQCPAEQALPALQELGAILRDAKAPPALRGAAVSALCFLGEPAYAYYADMLKIIVADEPDDPLGTLDETVGQSLVTLCKDPYEAGLVKDKELFYQAALKLMDHKRQSGRTAGMELIANIPLEDFHRVADKVQYIIDDKDVTYHSYHNQGPRGAAISILVKLNIKEGVQYLLDTLDTETGKWGFKVRMIMSVLPKYGANAKPVLEKLKADPRFKDIEKGRFGGQWRDMVKAIESPTTPGQKMISFEEAKQAGKK